MKFAKQSAQLEASTLPHGAASDCSPGAFAIERAARTCYKSEGLIGPGSAKKLIGKLKGLSHEAMLEFADATFRIVCDRGVSHEIVRHRIASYAQESTRYCNYSNEKHGGEITVIEPPGLGEDTKVWEAWATACRAAEMSYMEMLSRGITPQIARSVLPTCLKTEIVVKMNFREWLHFLKLRTAPAAHPQMREVAEMIGRQLAELCPEVFG